MELAEQGELLDAVLANRVAVNKQRQYVWQMLQAVSYLHKHNIGHRDISLENLLLHQDTVRLMDYGNAVQSHSMTGQELRYFLPVGKDTYRAPECFIPLGQSVATVTVPPDAGAGDLILHRNYHSLYQVRLPGGAKPGQDCQAELWGYAVQPADVFSCGVCFFCMCYGNGPWMTAQLTDEFFAYVYANQNGVTDLLQHWGKPLLDAEAMSLLLSMLCVDPLKRPSASHCLDSSWLSSLATAAVPLHSHDDDLML
ncbi:unnamed protein product [Effrenium voratum]|nr:unnamed protein product [Effrenium voratum]